MLVVFSVIFFVLRFYGQSFGYNVDVLVSDLGGLTYLYSTVGTIFAIFAAFVIVSESQDWNTLVNASKNEVSEIRELLSGQKNYLLHSPKSFLKISNHTWILSYKTNGKF